MQVIITKIILLKLKDGRKPWPAQPHVRVQNQLELNNPLPTVTHLAWSKTKYLRYYLVTNFVQKLLLGHVF